MINIKGNLVAQSDVGEVKLMNEDDKLILRVEDWDTMNFLISAYKDHLTGLVSNKKQFTDQTILLRVQDTDVLSWKGKLPVPINFRSYFRILRTYLKS